MSSDALHRIIKQAQLEDEPLFLGDASARASSPAHKAHSLERLAQEQYQQKRLEAEKEADRIMNEARAEAARLLQEAQQKVTQIEKQAYQEGLQRGEADGRAQHLQALQAFQTVLLEAQNERRRMLANTESEVVHLVLQTVRKILKIEPIINEQVLVRVIRDALERLGQKVDVHIDVNPQDLDLLHFSLTQIEDLALEIVIDTDVQIEPGGCRIRSRAGEIDARLSTQFDAVAQSFLALADGTEPIPTGEEHG